MEPQCLLHKINAIRKKTLPLFSTITLSPAAIRLVCRLFLHPYCVNTTNLQKFVGSKPVSLSILARHIITAFPQTICAYALSNHKTFIAAKDILRCFALDHCRDVQNHHLENIYSPAYALAHTLTIGRIQQVRQQKDERIADLYIVNSHKKITFKNVFVPTGLQCRKGNLVFQHFGVVIETGRKQSLFKLTQDLNQHQKKIAYFQKIFQASHPRINFGRPGLHPFDLLEKIINAEKHPEQNKKIPSTFKLREDGKVTFAK